MRILLLAAFMVGIMTTSVYAEEPLWRNTALLGTKIGENDANLYGISLSSQGSLTDDYISRFYGSFYRGDNSSQIHEAYLYVSTYRQFQTVPNIAGLVNVSYRVDDDDGIDNEISAQFGFSLNPFGDYYNIHGIRISGYIEPRHTNTSQDSWSSTNAVATIDGSYGFMDDRTILSGIASYNTPLINNRVEDDVETAMYRLSYGAALTFKEPLTEGSVIVLSAISEYDNMPIIGVDRKDIQYGIQLGYTF